MRNGSLFILITLFVTMSFSIVACQSAEEKAGEALVEQMTGAEVDVNGDEVKIEGKDGSFIAGESLEWPAEEMGDIPVPPANITCVMKDSESTVCTVGLDKFKKEDAEQYFEELKELGFEGGMSMADEDSIFLTGTRDDGSILNFVYNPSPEEATISFDRGEQ